MKKITSFTINHLALLPGIYVSRKDPAGNTVVTTFDIRMTRPNYEPVMNTAEIHTIEHLAATFLRNHPQFGPKTLYFGPMGCRTGFYLLLTGDYESRDIVPLMKELSGLKRRRKITESRDIWHQYENIHRYISQDSPILQCLFPLRNALAGHTIVNRPSVCPRSIPAT